MTAPQPAAPATPAGAGLPRGSGSIRTALRAARRDTALASGLVAVHQLAEAAVPLLVGVVVDRAVGPGDPAALAVWLGVLAAVFAVLAAAGIAGYDRVHRSVETAAHAVRLRLIDRLLDSRGGADGAGAPGLLVATVSLDSPRVAQAAHVVAIVVGVLAAVGGAAAALLVVSLPLAVAVLLGVPAVAVVGRSLSAPLARAAEQQQDAVTGAAAHAADLLAGLRTVKGLGAEQEAHRRYQRASARTVVATGRAAGAEGRQAAASLAAAGLPLLLVAAVGVPLVRDGEVTVGQLVAALGLTSFLAGPLGRAVFAAALWARVRASARRVDALLAAPLPRPPDPRAGGRPRSRTGAGVTLRGIVLPAGRVDLDLGPHELLAVVPLDPAVVPALLEPLAGVAGRERVAAGTVAVGGSDAAALPVEDLRACVLVAGADGVLPDRVLADNVPAAAGSPAAELRDEVAAEAGGPQVEVGDAGAGLSGGQRQRLLLARALAADPPVLVLCEPTSALDPVTELRAVTRLRAARAGRCTLAITSSPVLLATADRVVVVGRDGVVAAGRHDELVRRCPAYRDAVT